MGYPTYHAMSEYGKNGSGSSSVLRFVIKDWFFVDRKSGGYEITCGFTYDGTMEYPGFFVIAGVVTAKRFLQRVQAASRLSL